VTAAVDLAGNNDVVYDSWHGNGNPPAGGSMDMRVEVVFYGE
jgi:hypothetical protein